MAALRGIQRGTDSPPRHDDAGPVAPPEPPSQPRRWLIPASAGVIVVVAAIVGVALISGDGGDGAAAETTPLETVTTWIDRFETGDVAGYEALIAEDATFVCIDCSYGNLDQTGPYFPRGSTEDRGSSGLLGASGGSLNAACSGGGSIVNCDIRVTSAFGFADAAGQPTNEYTARLVFTVEDGLITNYEHRAFAGNLFDYAQIGAYEAWLRDANPAAHDELFAFGTMLTAEAAQVDRHRSLVADWAAARAEAASSTTAGVNWHPQQAGAGNEGAVAGAEASLVRSDSGIAYEFNTNSMTAGNAYTLWVVVVNKPSACADQPCAAGDVIGNAEVDAQVLYGTGLVADATGVGSFAGTLAEGPLAGWLPDRSFQDAATAEIHLVINDHGPEIAEFMPGMIETYRGGCADDSPFPGIFPATALADGSPGPNTCLLYQASIFLAP